MQTTSLYLNRRTTFDDTSTAQAHHVVLLAHLGRYRNTPVPKKLAAALRHSSWGVLNDEARAAVTSHSFRGNPEADAAFRAFVEDAVTIAAPNTAYAVGVMMSTTTRYVKWCRQQGWPLSPDIIWSVRAIDIYSTTANQDRSEGTRRNYRAQLMRISEVLLPGEHPERPTPLSKRSTALPYTDFEMKLFRRWAEDQLTDFKRDRAMVMLTLCAGAGLRPRELPYVGHDQVQVDDEGVLIHVGGDEPREVPLLAEWEEWMLSLLDRRPTDQSLWGPVNRRNTSNLTSSFTENSHGRPPRADRLRHTWWTHHLAAGVPLKDLQRAGGVEKLQQLHLLLEHVQLRDDADYRRIFRSEGQR